MEMERIKLDHGSGGKLSQQLMEEIILPAFGNPLLNELHDGAVLSLSGKAAFTTDSVVWDACCIFGISTKPKRLTNAMTKVSRSKPITASRPQKARTGVAITGTRIVTKAFEKDCSPLTF